MSSMELLNWARGPGLQISIAIFLLGTIVRVLEMWLLGRKQDLSEARSTARGAGWRTVWHRSVPAPGMMKSSPVVFFGGYIFHIGFFVVLLFFVPHILLFKDLFGFGWPGLPNGIIHGVTVISILALVALLVHRIINPVRRFLSTFQDYFVWLVTFLPFITGYFAIERELLPYTQMLAIHILSVELLLVVLPFTKLIHTVTFLFSRWYNGAAAGRKGVQV